MSVTINDTADFNANDVRDFARNVPSQHVEAFRCKLADAINAKLAQMRATGARAPSAANVANARRWERDVAAGKHDNACRVMLALGMPADFPLRTLRGGSESFNLYAIPKVLHAALCFMGRTPVHSQRGMPATIRGTIEGLLAGAHTGRKGIANYLNDYMNARGAGAIPGTYSSGSTQSSSSCHALAALGFLNVKGFGRGVGVMMTAPSYEIPDAAAEQALRFLCGEEAASE